jgi:hypothetical protein
MGYNLGRCSNCFWYVLPSHISVCEADKKALQFPYVIAFEPTFIEVRSVHTGDLVQIIPGNNISCLFADTPPSRINSAPIQPTRQMMFNGPPGAYRTPPQPGYPTQGYPNQQAGYGNGFRPPPNQQGFMPPPGQGQGQGQPGNGAPRFNRDQIIFTSEEGHVQFLKLPPSGQRGSTVSTSSANTSSTTLVSGSSGPGGRLESIRGSR